MKKQPSMLHFCCVKGICPIKGIVITATKEEIKMQLDVWSVIAIIIVVIGFFGGIWYEHR